MKIQAATTIQVPITKVGANYFPDIQKIAGRKITAITFHPKQLPIDGGDGYDEYTPSLYLSLTDNGSRYFMSDVDVRLLTLEYTKGVHIPINRKLSVMDCYINVSYFDTVFTAVFTIWYELETYSTGYGRNDCQKFDNIDIPVVKDGIVTQNFFPDIRNLANKKLTSIWWTSVKQTPNYNDGNTLSIKDAVYISLVKGSFNVLDRVPLDVFYQYFRFERLTLDGIICDFSSCYAEVAAGQENFNKKYINLTVQYRD